MASINHICFLGTPDFSVPILKQCLTTFNDTTFTVISMPDRPKGRRGTPTPSPVRQIAINHGISSHTPKTKQELTETIHSIKPDVLIVVAYGMILEKEITDAYYCINIHASILPKYRGASPIQSALMNGDKETGNTLIRMNEKMDEGHILKTTVLPILNDDTLESLSEKLSNNAALLIVDFIQTDFINDTYQEKPQNHNHATYTKKIAKDELEIVDFTDLESVHNKIRALSPKPGAYIIHNQKRLKLIRSSFNEQTLSLLEVQPEGKKIMNYTDYLRGTKNGFKL